MSSNFSSRGMGRHAAGWNADSSAGRNVGRSAGRNADWNAGRNAGFRPGGRRGRADGEPLQPFGAMELPEPTEFTDEQLRRRRRLARWISIPIAAILIAAGTFLIVLQSWSLTSRGEYAKGDFSAAEAGYLTQVALTRGSPVKWVGLYNLGTTLLAQDEATQAVTYLESALAQVPQAIRSEDGSIESYSYECAVRLNLALAYVASGDAGAAEEVVSICLSSGGSGGSSGFDNTEEESTDANGGGESEGTDSSENSDDSGEQDSESTDDPYADETDEQRKRREELEEKNQQQDERQRESEEEQNSQENGGGGVQGW